MTAFRLGVVAAFSGSRAGTNARHVHEVDRDDFDALFARLSPQLSLELPFCPELALDAFEQLHPDALLDRVPAFAALLETRATGGSLASHEPAPVARETPSTSASGTALLDELLGERGQAARTSRGGADPELARILDEVASPHAERIDHAGIEARVRALDADLGAKLRKVLHHPRFQSLEASWRSLRQLVRSSETGEALRIHAVDLALESEDALDLLERIVTRAAQEQESFDLLLLDREIDASDGDLALLAGLARIATSQGVACALGAAQALWDPKSDSAATFLAKARGLPGAARIALCGPRVLSRLPYSPSGEPVERFAFEEVTAGDGHAASLCWTSGAFALVQALLDAVGSTGTPSDGPRFALREGLPVHASGPRSPAGPTERALSESEAARLRERGIVPLASIRGRDALLVASFRSLTGAPLFAG